MQPTSPHCIVASSMRDTRTRDLMGQSWAAFMLANHPEATRVTVVTQRFDLPSIHAYAAGQRPAWTTLYGARFDRKDPR